VAQMQWREVLCLHEDRIGGCQIICVSVAEGPILEKGIRDDDIQA
jgi:hypothetical protein